MSGGALPRIKGDVFERAVCADQRARGRLAFRVRQGGGEVVDIVALEPMTGWSRAFLIQAKRGGYMRPKERDALIERARLGRATALLARPENGGIAYEVLT